MMSKESNRLVPSKEASMNDGLVFVLQLPDSYLLYAPLHDVSALVNKSALLALGDDELSQQFTEVEEIRQIVLRQPDFYPQRRQGKTI